MSTVPIGRDDSRSAAGYRLGLVLVTASATAWSTAGFFIRLIPLDIGTTLFWRGIFGALTGLAFIAARERGAIWKSLLGLGRSGILFSLLSTAGMVSFVAALKLTTVAHVAIIYATAPFVTTALAWIALRERASIATLAASGAAFGGIVFTVLNGTGEGSLQGDALAFLMTVLMSTAIVALRRTTVSIPMLPSACLSALLSSLVCLPFAEPFSASPAELVELGAFGISNMGLGLILFMAGATLIPAAQTALIGALDAPLAPVWVWLAFGETPKATTLIGGGVVLVAVVGNMIHSAGTSEAR